MSAPGQDDESAPTYGPGFWVGLALGLPLVAFGLRGVLGQFSGPALESFVVYFVGGAALHDLVVAPAVCVVGWLVVRAVPKVALGPVQAALLASGVIGLVSWPLVRGYGITPGEPSFLSRDYVASVLIAWGVVWTLAAIAVGVRVVNARRR